LKSEILKHSVLGETDKSVTMNGDGLKINSKLVVALAGKVKKHNLLNFAEQKISTSPKANFNIHVNSSRKCGYETNYH
jgi:hypothetical protein